MDTEPQLARRSGAVGLAKAALVRGQGLAGSMRGGPPRPGLRILYYHRISAERDPLAVTPDGFRRQMDALAASGQRVVDLYEIDDLELEPREAAIALTFDDGYRDVLQHGLPVLREHGFPSTVFVVPGAIAGDAAFSWYAPGSMPPLAGWDELREEERAGLVRFEPHTVTHPVLTATSAEDARSEIAESKAAVEKELGRPARIFCYPGGYYSPREVELVRECGYRAAVTCEFGANSAPFAHNELRRTIVERSDPLWLFRARLAGATDAPPPGRRTRRVERLAA
ncbi:MAG TPA: polysaccharide deacetylase family protein [Gaiellales bacterium]|jgi:peptidoglycan/xylan/chitin deacetylase (PgdA/CDA1 family)|nr:polysaccharide deacetylase family protein [Gaiellales bacterium]